MKNDFLSGRFRAGAFGLSLALVVTLLALIPLPSSAREAPKNASANPPRALLQTSSPATAHFDREAPDSPSPCEDDDSFSDSDCVGPSVSPNLPTVIRVAAERPAEALDAPTPWIFERNPALRKRILKKYRPAPPRTL